jgi:hypothetical protein
VEVREKIWLAERSIPPGQRLPIDTASRPLPPGLEIKLGPEGVRIKVVSAVQKDSATLSVVVRDPINQLACKSQAAPGRSDDEMDDADLVARQVVQQVASRLVVYESNEQRPLVGSLSESCISKKADRPARLPGERKDAAVSRRPWSRTQELQAIREID